jgi:hypothetical protein
MRPRLALGEGLMRELLRDLGHDREFCAALVNNLQ